MYLLRYVWEGKGKGKALILEGIQCVSSSFDAFSGSWAYRTSTKTAMSLTQFQLVHGVKVVLLIECEIPSLKHLKCERCFHHRCIYPVAEWKQCQKAVVESIWASVEAASRSFPAPPLHPTKLK